MLKALQSSGREQELNVSLKGLQSAEGGQDRAL
jgi:hypothetical protein